MKQEMHEKKIIEDIQNYSSPEPDRDFEERLKQQFLHKVQQVKRKRKFFRTVTWSGAVAASVFVGAFLYQSDLLLINNQSADKSEMSMNREFSTPDADVAITENEKSQTWQDADPSLLESAPVYESSDSEIKLYQDQDYKRLYAVKGDQSMLVYESKSGIVSGPNLYPFPSSPTEAFVVFHEVFKGADGLENKSVFHVLKLNEDATLQEVAGIPQAGFQSNHQLKWSPSNSYPFLVVENTTEWVVGLLEPETLQFNKLYGDITAEEDMKLDLPEKEFYWAVDWIDDTSLLLYNAPGQAFYKIMVFDGIAAEIKAGNLDLQQGQRVRSIDVQDNNNRYAVVRVGGQVLDVGYHGNQTIYVLDMNPKSPFFEEVRMTPDQKQGMTGVDHYYLGDFGEKNILLGSVVNKGPNKYTLYFSAYSVEEDAGHFDSMDFTGQIGLNDYFVHYSPNRQFVAVKVTEYPENQGAKEHLIVIDLKERKTIKTVTKDFISSVKWIDDRTLEINDEETSIVTNE